MSKGPGRVGRAIASIFAAAPDHAFTVDELCWQVYPGIDRVEKSYRAVVLRAAHKQWPTLMAIRAGKTIAFFTLENVTAYAMARLKPSSLRDDQILARLQPGGDQYDYMGEGGPWWIYVEQYKAERDGDVIRWRQLQTQLEERSWRRTVPGQAGQ